MINAHRKRTLVIGLGWYARPILQKVRENFSHYELQDDYLSSIWLPPVTPSVESQDTTLPLSLSNVQLKNLYYQSTTQLWSSVNWRAWGNAIVGNRLWGKLAIHTNYEAVYQMILQQLSNLVGTSGDTVYIYVIGHAHDPFASGAFIDLAYLLQNQNLTHLSYRTYGMLVLPNMANDPLSEDTPTADESLVEPGGDLTFALLKELNFYQQSPSFYNNYQIQYQLPVENVAPFQRGDIYLIGGNNTLEYETAIQQCADFIFVQSQSNLSQHISQSQLNTGTFSTFSIAMKSLSDDVDFNTRFVTRRYHVYQQLRNDNSFDYRNNDVINGWVGNLPTDQSSELKRLQNGYLQEIKDLGNTRIEDHVVLTLSARNNQNVKSRNDLDQQFYQVRDLLLRIDAVSRQEIINHLQQIDLQMDEQLTRLYVANQWNFRKIGDVYNILILRINQQIDISRSAIKDNYEPTLRAVQNTLHNHRMEYSYYDNRSFLPLRWLINAAVIFSGMLFLFTLGLYVLMIAWVILTVSIIQFVPRFYYQNNLSRSHDEVINTQLEFLQALEHLGTQQRRLIYYKRLLHLLTSRIMHGAVTYTDYLDDILNKRITHIHNSVPAVEHATPDYDLLSTNLTAIRQEIFQTMMAIASDNQIDVNQQLDAITRPIVEQDTAEVPQATQDRLEESLNLVRADAEFLTTWSQQSLSTSQVDQMHEVVGVTHLSAQIAEAYQNTNIQMADFRLVQLGDANKNLSPYIVYIQLQNNLPFYSLSGLQIWHDKYDNTIRERGTTFIGDTIFIHRSRLHPTQIGVASQDLSPITTLPHLADYPNFVMAVTVLIRFFSPKYRLRQWCHDLGVNDVHPIDFSELCGAFHANLSVVSKLLRDAEDSVGVVQNFRPSLYYNDIIREIENRYDFIVENYPDWQIWVCQKLLDDIKAQNQAQVITQRTRAIEALATIYAYLVNKMVGEANGNT